MDKGIGKTVSPGRVNPIGTVLNIANRCEATAALGPGLRSVVWVQGCALHCPGCLAPDWIPIRPAHLVAPDELAVELLRDPRVRGLTISGGEPMLQAAGLSRLVWEMRQKRNIDVICFSGFLLEQLVQTPPGPGVFDLLSQVDVLIDGPYIARRNDNTGLRGSTNQRIHYFTDRLADQSLETWTRKAEVHLMDGAAMLVGVPPRGIHEAFSKAIDQVQNLEKGIVQYERV